MITVRDHFEALREADRDRVALALAAVTEANSRLAHQYDRDKEQSNEWRGALDDQRADFVRRSELRGYLIALVALAGSIALNLIFHR